MTQPDKKRKNVIGHEYAIYRKRVKIDENNFYWITADPEDPEKENDTGLERYIRTS
jgi:DNA-directed RNA polymerase subunit N (RpoN/RPB10)